MNELSSTEKERYSRHILLEEIGMEGQLKLKNARVLVIGSGGLGCPVLQYLAAAGVGKIGIVDYDVVENSNLQRQILFGEKDVNKNKAETARQKLTIQNPYIELQAYPYKITSENAIEIISDYDIIADGSDNFATRYLMNDACVLNGKTYVYASVSRFEGQLSVCNYLQEDGKRSPDYRDLYPNPPAPGEVLNCAEAGVIGALTGIMGCFQANEVIKIITGAGEVLSSKLFILNVLNMQTHILHYSYNPENPLRTSPPQITGLIDYEAFCKHPHGIVDVDIKEITYQELCEWNDSGKSFQLLDVREEFEYEERNIGGLLIPLGNLDQSLHLISKDMDVVVHCKSGGRSKKAVLNLQKNGFKNVFNLIGGIDGVKGNALRFRKI